tara:strand:- start:3928 stop:4527 length:600 start_codon:yes stop_codon:yes gene_type:complete
MVFKGFGKMFRQIDQDMASLALLSTINAAERTVRELQQEGPSWTGRFSNSWEINGPQGQQAKGDGQPGEPRKITFAKAPFTGPQAVQVLGRTGFTTNKVVFKIDNFSPWAAYASDLADGQFFPRSPGPETQLGKSKLEQSGQSRPKGTHRRYQIYEGGSGSASRTAKENWLTNYVNGGRLDKSIQIEVDKMSRRLGSRT